MILSTSSNLTTFIYDGSFEGLMSVMYNSFKRRIIPENIISLNLDNNLTLGHNIRIKTDPEKSDLLVKAVENNISQNALKNIVLAYLSEVSGFEKLIYGYLELGWQYKHMLDSYIIASPVNKINKIASKVKKEKHLMLGIIRFKKTTNNIFFSTIEPDYNILPLISPHFAERMPDCKWIIYDKKRNLATCFINKKWEIYDFEITDHITYSESENFYQDLWNVYFKTIAISSRKNKKLQKQFIPARYWNNLIEKISYA